MTIIQILLSATGYLLAIFSMVAAARDARTTVLLSFAGTAMIALIAGYAGWEPLAAAHIPINDAMIGIVTASIGIHVIRLVNGAVPHQGRTDLETSPNQVS